MKPKINKKKCINCGECINLCPVNHFKEEKGIVKVRAIPEEPCLACEACVINCPQEAITLEED